MLFPCVEGAGHETSGNMRALSLRNSRGKWKLMETEMKTDTETEKVVKMVHYLVKVGTIISTCTIVLRT